jgi:hypothetical protein
MLRPGIRRTHKARPERLLKVAERCGGAGPGSSQMQRWTRRLDIVPDIVSLIIWLIAGVPAGNGAGELLKGDFDLGPGNTVAGGIGGVVGAQVLQTLIPALRRFDIGPVVGQVIGAAASGAVLTVLTAAVKARRRRGKMLTVRKQQPRLLTTNISKRPFASLTFVQHGAAGGAAILGRWITADRTAYLRNFCSSSISESTASATIRCNA